MESTVRKKPALNSMYQNKLEEIYPEVEISAKSVKALNGKGYNAVFPMHITARVVGIRTGEKDETFYKLEIREAGIIERPTEEQSIKQLKKTIEKNIEESIEEEQ